jgi:hypothetical protein
VQLGEADGTAQTVHDSRPCLVCYYNLQGLPAAGVCPECGTPVADSLRGNLLRYSPVLFLHRLRTGISLVFWAALASTLLMVLGVVARFVAAGAAAAAGGPPGGGWSSLVDAVVAGLTAIISGLSIYAWWLFSSPDPALLGQDRAESARRWLRWGVTAVAVTTLAAFIVSTAEAAGLLPSVAPVGPGGGPAALSSWPMVLSGVIWLAGFIAWGVQFFAAMLYLRHMSMRMLDLELYRLARRNIWLLPVLYTVGALICVGPFIALVLYLIMLWGVRERLSRVLEEAGSLAAGREPPAAAPPA